MTRPIIEHESFVSAECPTTMIKDGSKILLYNPQFAKIPGVNPIQLDSLEDYEEYIAWQRSNKLNCPILHLEKVFDVQGDAMYEIKPSFKTDLNTGGYNHSLPIIRNPKEIIDAALDDPPYNIGQYPAYDKDNQDIGRINVIDNSLA